MIALIVTLAVTVALVIGWKMLTAMAAGIAEIRASWETVGRIRSERMKLDAEAAAVGNVVVPEGHALVSFESGEIRRVERSLDPNQTAVKAMDLKWKAFQWERRNQKPDMGIPASEEAPLDLVAWCRQPGQCILFRGGARSGKTSAAKWVSYDWISRGRIVHVVGTRVLLADWGHECHRWNGRDAVEGLKRVDAVVEARRVEADRLGVKSDDPRRFEPVLVVIDDTPDLVSSHPETRAFIQRASLMFAGSNVIPLIITQASTAKGNGVDDLGAGVLENFLVVKVEGRKRGPDGSFLPGRSRYLLHEGARDKSPKLAQVPPHDPPWRLDNPRDKSADKRTSKQRWSIKMSTLLCCGMQDMSGCSMPIIPMTPIPFTRLFE
ncbi:MAG: hypothetical protein AAF514_05745, partial [Verrucomicrobiota bacterium]